MIGKTDKRLNDTRVLSAQPLHPPCTGDPGSYKSPFMPIEDTRYVGPRGSSRTNAGSESLTNAVHVAEGKTGSSEY